jgi:uncharacterized protein involved in exopolysaccharide biosynthesis
MSDYRGEERLSLQSGKEDIDSADSQEVWRYLGFALRALWRRKLLAIFVVAVVLAGTFALIRLTPKSYRAETKILAERQQTLPSIMRSTAADESPTHAASEIIHRQDNLISIVKKTHLADTWEFPPNVPLSADQKLNLLVRLLDQRLLVAVGDGTVGISIAWPDPQMAYEIVEAARLNFLDARRTAEIGTLDEWILLMEARAETLRAEIDTIEAEAQRQSARDESKGSTARRRRSPVDAVATQLKSEIEAKRRTIREAEDARRRRREELEAQLAKELSNYGRAYPTVISLEEQIEALSKEPRYLMSLRAELQQLENVYSRRAAKPEADDSDALAKRRSVGLDEADTIEGRLRSAQRKYETWLEKLESARIDLDTARTFFNHRYSLITPAMVPVDPDKPKVPLYIAVGAILAFLLAVIATTMADVLSGRVVEEWQIERSLELPILGEVRRP